MDKSVALAGMERRIKAILIDDEQSACDILSQLLMRFCKDVDIVDIQNNVEDGVKSIQAHNPDVVFLDIQMPKYAGFEIVNFFPTVNFEMIFVTAYDNYAVKAFELSAVDYLLKPIEIDKLVQAINRLQLRLEQNFLRSNYESLIDNLKQKELKRLVIPDNGNQKVIDIPSIVAIEASESYSIIHTVDHHFMVSKNLKHFERLLSENTNFFRSHKSWIINLTHISSYSKGKLEIRLDNRLYAKLSKFKKQAFEMQLN